jgi:hypothetical protein
MDVPLSARRDGPTCGLDMTDEMRALAEINTAETDVENVLFPTGPLEDIPLLTNSVDVVIPNCVSNRQAKSTACVQVFGNAAGIAVPLPDTERAPCEATWTRSRAVP